MASFFSLTRGWVQPHSVTQVRAFLTFPWSQVLTSRSPPLAHKPALPPPHPPHSALSPKPYSAISASSSVYIAPPPRTQIEIQMPPLPVSTRAPRTKPSKSVMVSLALRQASSPIAIVSMSPPELTLKLNGHCNRSRRRLL